MKKFYSKQEIEELTNIDLLTYLINSEPTELVKVSSQYYSTKTHDSMMISNEGWFWFSRGFGGRSAFYYLLKVKDKKYKEALDILYDFKTNNKDIKYVILNKCNNMKLIIPEKNDNNDIAVKYLISRGIDKEIIEECIEKELLFEEKGTHNAVFLGYDFNNNVQYVFKRGTTKKRFMQEVIGSQKAFSFRLKSNLENNSVHIFESSIDLLSYATLLKIDNKEWYNENLLSLGGAYKPLKNEEYKTLPISLRLYLNNNPNTNKIILHLDNDLIGRGATKAIKKMLDSKYEIINEPPLYGKDFNDYLCKKLGKEKNNIEKER